MEQTEQILILPIGVKVKVTPGEEVYPWPNHLPVPRLGVFEWEPDPDGRYRAVFRTQSIWVRMREKVTEEYGLGITYQSLRRLMIAGFVESRQLTPGQFALNLQSFYKHCEKARDPEFWTGANLKRYMEAL